MKRAILNRHHRMLMTPRAPDDKKPGTVPGVQPGLPSSGRRSRLSLAWFTNAFLVKHFCKPVLLSISVNRPFSWRPLWLPPFGYQQIFWFRVLVRVRQTFYRWEVLARNMLHFTLAIYVP